MYFDSLSAALTMDGHGGYVWAAYAVTAFVIVLLLVAPAVRSKRLLREIGGDIRRSKGPSNLARNA